MIRYSLKCAEGHVFDAWFRDSAAYDALAGAGRVACAVCGDARVEKTVMAPSIGGRERTAPPEPAEETPAPMLSGAPGPVERALAQLRQFLSDKADYVGRGFADEARRIHLGEADERPIWGEATPDEARELREEGVPVAPLPLLSRRDD